MFDSKVSKRPKPKTLAGPKSTLPETTAFSVSVPSQDQIRERAYQLYECRGGQDGQDQQDWLTAEQQILNQRR
ncbi:MAG: DUF2934 domain-containing protein [Candidatus Korobacteraceae bacterium]|jgi:hypothetical protein